MNTQAAQEAQEAQATQSTSSIQTISQNFYIGSGQNVQFQNQTIILNCNITVNNTGKLILDNITLIFNNTELKSTSLVIKTGGSLQITKSQLEGKTNASSSKIVFNKNSTGILSSSDFSMLGGGITGENNSAMVIRSNNVDLNNCSFYSSNYGIFIDSCAPSLKQILISKCNVGIIGTHAGGVVDTCTIVDCSTSFQLTSSSNITVIDSVFDRPNVNAGSLLVMKRSLNIQTIFETPYVNSIQNADILITNNNVTVYATPWFGGTQPRTDAFGRISKLILTEKLYSDGCVTNYTTLFSMKYLSRMINARVIPINQTTSEIIALPNQQPNPGFASVSPMVGTSSSVFNFKIKYSDADGDSPSKMQFEIDGVAQNISIPTGKGVNDWITGVWLYYNTTLGIGEHRYRIITNDGLGFSDVSIPAGNSKTYIGPSVARSNSKPLLSDGLVTPLIGDINTVFVYRIGYYDFDSDSASIAKVYIDNISHPMKLLDTTGGDADNDNENSNKLWFEFETKLLKGPHEFYFKFKDDNGSSVVRWPEEDDENSRGAIAGPNVVPLKNKMPILGNGTVSPSFGHRLYRFSFRISYYDHEGDVPTVAQVMIDGVSFDLARAKIAQELYFYETELPLGEHYYHFVFWVAENDHYIRYPSENSTEIVGPIVLDIPPDLTSGQVAPSEGTSESIFTFSILYEDFENDPANKADVVINYQTFSMHGVDIIDAEGNAKILFSYSTLLDLGEYEYYFVIQSGDFILRYPGTESIMGPSVKTQTNSIDIEPKSDTEVDDEPGDNSTETDNNDDAEDNDINKTNLEDGNDNNNKDDTYGLSDDDRVFIILDYKKYCQQDEMGYKYTFIIVCQMNNKEQKSYDGWVEIDGKSYLMFGQKISDENIYNFTLNIHLSNTEHYYHFILKTSDDESELRLPYKGEFVIKAIDELASASKENNEPKQEPVEKLANEHKMELIQVFVVVMLILAVLFFSFYRRYVELRKGK